MNAKKQLNKFSYQVVHSVIMADHNFYPIWQSTSEVSPRGDAAYIPAF